MVSIMNISSSKKKLIQILLIIYWITFLYETDSYHSIYVLCGIISTMGVLYNYNYSSSCTSSRSKSILLIASCVYSAIVIAANWMCFSPLKSSLINVIFVAIGGFCVAWNILFLLSNIPFNFLWTLSHPKLTVKEIFIVTFLPIVLIDLLYLFLVAYPGNLSADSISQFGQILANKYTNHHPFWHTMLIKFWYEMGFLIFNDINAAVATYTVFQIICLALCFSYVIITLFQIHVAPKYILLCYLWIVLMPYHIAYSSTIWKDILFAAAVTTFTTSLFRILRNIGNSTTLNYIIFIISGIGFGILRTNGWIALLITTVVLFFTFRKHNKKILLICFSVLTFTYIITRPLLAYYNVPQADFIESLSIPAQQIARVVSNELPLTSEQQELLNQIVDLDEIAKCYTPYISDPVKNAVRNFGNQQYLLENKRQYLSLWISIGIEYPSAYLSAWIEQTKGYWNGGYPYWIFTTNVKENSMGIERLCKSESLNELFLGYFRAFEHFSIDEGNYFLQFFVSIGFQIWLILFFFLYTIMHKKKEFILTIPVLAVILTLLIATPVFSEFRYAYSIFTTIPILFFATFYTPSNQ